MTKWRKSNIYNLTTINGYLTMMLTHSRRKSSMQTRKGNNYNWHIFHRSSNEFRRLLGLMIWSIDLDDRQHTALDAVLWPSGLGKFDNQNGVGSRPTQEWNSGTDNQCDWSGMFLLADSLRHSDSNIDANADCGKTCSGNTQNALKDPVQCYTGGEKKFQQLCCPLNATPNPGLCRWSVGKLWSLLLNQIDRNRTDYFAYCRFDCG
jgi:hypothetical protein